MKLSCPGCGARWRLPDENVPGRGARATCRTCGFEMIVPAPVPKREAPARGSAAWAERERRISRALAAVAVLTEIVAPILALAAAADGHVFVGACFLAPSLMTGAGVAKMILANVEEDIRKARVDAIQGRE